MSPSARMLACALLLGACAGSNWPTACGACGPYDDGLATLEADPRFEAARARGASHARASMEARREAASAEEDEARDALTTTARLYALAAIVEEERRALEGPVEPEGALETPPEARLTSAREEVSSGIAQNLEEAAAYEERRLARSARERRGDRAQAATQLRSACEAMLARAAGVVDAASLEALRARFEAAKALRDQDARYVALDALAIDLLEALRGH